MLNSIFSHETSIFVLSFWPVRSACLEASTDSTNSTATARWTPTRKRSQERIQIDSARDSKRIAIHGSCLQNPCSKERQSTVELSPIETSLPVVSSLIAETQSFPHYPQRIRKVFDSSWNFEPAKVNVGDGNHLEIVFASAAPNFTLRKLPNGESIYWHESIGATESIMTCACTVNCAVERCLRRNFGGVCTDECCALTLCQNRLVFETEISSFVALCSQPRLGTGVMAMQDLPVGFVICSYDGEYLTNQQHKSREKLRKKLNLGKSCYTVEIASALRDEPNFYIDSTYFDTIGRYFNSTCTKAFENVLLIPRHIDGRVKLIFTVCQPVKAGNFLNIQYSKSFDVGSCQCAACT